MRREIFQCRVVTHVHEGRQVFKLVARSENESQFSGSIIQPVKGGPLNAICKYDIH